MTEPTYYKWLMPKRITTHAGVKFPARKGQWTPRVDLPLVMCQRGYHGTTRDHLLEWLPYSDETPELWRVEVDGAFEVGDTKFVCERMKLVERVKVTDQMLRLFACDVAEDVLSIFEAKFPNDQRPRQAIEVSRRYANGEATKAELAVARDAADAAGAAARDADAARAAAWAAGAAAWAAGAAARAAGAAARDAGAAAGAAAGVKYNDMFATRLGL